MSKNKLKSAVSREYKREPLMPTKQRRYALKTKEAKQILTEGSASTKLDLEALFGDKATVEIVESEVGPIYLIGGKPLLFKAGDKVLPTLHFADFLAKAPKIVVDMGAVPYVCKGATVMAPGIVQIEGKFSKGDHVVVVDVKFRKALGLGETLMDSETAKGTKKGPIVKTSHWVSDKIWDQTKTIS
jgi:PUA-domain protein